MRKLKKYKPTKFRAKGSYYDEESADFAVAFIESLCHTKGTWAGKKFELIDWQEQIIRDLFGTLKPNGYRQFNTAYIEIPKPRFTVVQPTVNRRVSYLRLPPIWCVCVPHLASV